MNYHKQCSSDYVLRLDELNDKIVIENNYPLLKDVIESLKSSIAQRLSELKALIDGNLIPLLAQLDKMKVDLDLDDVNSIKANIHIMQPTLDQKSRLIRLSNAQTLNAIKTINDFSTKINFIIGESLRDQVNRMFKETKADLAMLFLK